MLAAWFQSLPVRLLYNAFLPPPPYHWVHPPPEHAKDNEPAPAGAGTVPLDPAGLSRSQEIATADAQAIVIFPAGVVAMRPRESSVNVTITPIDPAPLLPAPTGQRLDGNAYRIQAHHVPSAQEVTLAGSITVVLRYPVHATTVLRSAGAGWVALTTMRYPGTLQVLASSDQLGVFVAAGPSGRRSVAWVAYAAAAAGLAVAVAGFLLVRRRAGRVGPSGVQT